ncbi:carboxymuconolactone decarboxylase family protein [Mycobacterium sp. CVI_P3]|uniref:Carboxymuconolactone decarboxylase family protein n=1 Tax=Mycobacterium pinniadriaticum TaxID=2994102 RepID=A0ABT3SAD8_9MYCO|nr:carboxymuconolactone decarboxylase family protein [Mycobacterium pinniadriaticum]MCX2929863.1 carboxymuconolactone decarboxylase family protein [Mycobacterium pinniadriaticum]MCX2936488.1 carboxymuconolactone decarboxylase family protein [Mycobacterium pinniadriaticum]
MAPLPDPTDQLDGQDKALFDHMASARAHSDGRAQLGEVYVRMFNNPALAGKVGALGEQLRFNGTLPDDVRELAILRYATRVRAGYEWSHHQRPAMLAGLSADTIAEVTAGGIPAALPDASRAALQVVDAVTAHQSIPADVQDRVVAAYGEAGVVELVLLCGLYAIMSYMVFAFDIPVEEGLPTPPDALR